jgi:hypothetical protein
MNPITDRPPALERGGPVRLPAPPPAVAPATTEPRIRPFQREDIPAVVALRQQVFRHSAHHDAGELALYFARAFLDNPWRDLDLHSVVHLDGDGAVNGFLGVVPRRMRFRDRPIRVAVPTQLMVRPGSPPGAGIRLTRAILDGPQDLTLSDAANEAARRIWTRVGGGIMTGASLFWTVPLRPVRYAISRLGAGMAVRAFGVVTRPLAAALDGIDRWRHPLPTSVLVTEPMEPLKHLDLIAPILETWALRPDYDHVGLAWQLAEVRLRRELGTLEARLVRDTRGTLVGWYLYFANRGGVGEVLQLGCRPGDQGRVLAPLLVEARARGLVALAGRLDPSLLPAVSALSASIDRGGPWMLCHARDQELRVALLGGDGFFSRLEGEWWLNF